MQGFARTLAFESTGGDVSGEEWLTTMSERFVTSAAIGEVHRTEWINQSLELIVIQIF